MSERCEVCDRAECQRASLVQEYKTVATGVRPSNTIAMRDALMAAQSDCMAHIVDWRTRCLTAERERDAMRPVVEAAVAWVKGDWATARHKRAALADAIDAYRATKETTP